MKKQIIIGVIIFLVILILVPFVINHFIQLPAQFDVVGEPVNWLMFWPTYISAAVSSFMIYMTYLSLKQNREQLEVMKNQWMKELSPDLDIAIVNLPYRVPNETLAIEIKNFGKGVAECIKISIDSEFVNNFPHSAIKEQTDKICEKTYRILPGDTIIIPICLLDKISRDKTLFGHKITDIETEDIHKFLENFTILVKCEYEGCDSPIELTFTTEDKKWIRRSISSSLEDIAYHLEELESLVGNVDSLSLELSAIQSLLQNK